MKRNLAIIAVAAALVAGCSSGLSDAETVWCNGNRFAVGSAGKALGLVGDGPIGVEEFQRMMDGPAAVGGYSGDGTGFTVWYTITGADYDRACKAAYENR